MIYVGIYALIYLHTILGEGIVSRDGLPRGALPSGILKMEKYCPGHKVPVSKIWWKSSQRDEKEHNVIYDLLLKVPEKYMVHLLPFSLQQI